MLNNAVNDGVNGITQCPIPPGQSQVYTFKAEQYGTSWVSISRSPLSSSPKSLYARPDGLTLH